MKYIYFILPVILLFINLSCSSKITLQKEQYSQGVWIDAHTYRIYSVGGDFSNKPISIEARKKNSKKRALIRAREEIMIKFRKMNITQEAAAISDYSYKTDSKITLKLKKIINNGKILYINYDKSHACEIIYEVKADGLKEKVNKWIEYLPN